MSNSVYIVIRRSDGEEFSINKGDAPDWKIPSKGLEGFGEFQNDITTTNNALGDGGIISSSRVAQKDRTIKCVSRNHYLNDALRRRANSFFSPKYTYSVYLTYMGLTRWFEGTIHKYKLPTENVNRSMTMTITFLCASPYLKSYDNFGKDIASVQGRIAFPYLCSVDNNHKEISQGITGGVFNFATKIYLDNDGDVETYCKCIFEATGAVENPSLIINGHYVRVIDTMGEGDVIEIDFTKNPPTVRKNGENFVGHCDRTSAFDEMMLIVGTSEVGYTADNGTNLLKVSVYFNKLYSSI